MLTPTTSSSSQSTQTDLNQLENLMSIAKKSLSISMLLDLAFFSALGFPQETAENLAKRIGGGGSGGQNGLKAGENLEKVEDPIQISQSVPVPVSLSPTSTTGYKLEGNSNIQEMNKINSSFYSGNSSISVESTRSPTQPTQKSVPYDPFSNLSDNESTNYNNGKLKRHASISDIKNDQPLIDLKIQEPKTNVVESSSSQILPSGWLSNQSKSLPTENKHYHQHSNSNSKKFIVVKVINSNYAIVELASVPKNGTKKMTKFEHKPSRSNTPLYTTQGDFNFDYTLENFHKLGFPPNQKYTTFLNDSSEEAVNVERESRDRARGETVMRRGESAAPILRNNRSKTADGGSKSAVRKRVRFLNA